MATILAHSTSPMGHFFPISVLLTELRDRGHDVALGFVTEASGLPWLTFWPLLPHLRSRAAPPWGPGLRPLPGVMGRVRDALFMRSASGVFDNPTVRSLSPISARVGVPPIASADDYARRAPLKLVATARPFDYPHPDWDDSIQMIGTCGFEPTAEETPEWPTAIDRPIVLVSTSPEFHGDTDLARTALDALADEPVHVASNKDNQRGPR